MKALEIIKTAEQDDKDLTTIETVTVSI